jgi:hypothetical protein
MTLVVRRELRAQDAILIGEVGSYFTLRRAPAVANSQSKHSPRSARGSAGFGRRSIFNSHKDFGSKTLAMGAGQERDTWFAAADEAVAQSGERSCLPSL